MGIKWECFKHLFKKPFTKKYPFVKAKPYDKFRGRIVYKPDLCIGCIQCAKNCPSAAVKFFKKGKIDFNMGECFFCGLCVDVCPVNAIEFSDEFEFADKNPKFFNKIKRVKK